MTVEEMLKDRDYKVWRKVRTEWDGCVILSRTTTVWKNFLETAKKLELQERLFVEYRL